MPSKGPAVGLFRPSRDDQLSALEAIQTGDTQRLRRLITHDKRLLRSKVVEGNTLLFYAAIFGAHDIVKFLLDSGADPRAENDDQISIMCAAATADRLDVIRLLVEHGVSVNSPEGKPSPLGLSVTRGRARTAEALLELGAYVDSRTTNRRNTPLFSAPDTATAEVLIRFGADVNTRNVEGSVPLHGAALFGNAALVELLLRHGANPLARDAMDFTPLDSARRGSEMRGNPEMVTFFLQAMPTANIVGDWASTEGLIEAAVARLDS